MIASDDPIRKYEPLWGNWRVIELIGEGSYGRVYRVVRQDGGSYESAVKLISVPRSDADIHEARRMGMDMRSMSAYFAENAERIVKEISIMHSLKGEANIVSYEDHQIFHEEGSLQWDILIRMELLVPLEIYTADNQVTSDEVRRLGVEICSALETCAEYGIIHRDIKEANIFLNSRATFKLGDFGIAREIGGTGSMSMSMRGTPAYIAPEVYSGRRYDGRADIYSLGILMYKMLNEGRYPFLPPAPNPISLDDAEQAFARRIKGEVSPQPLHGDSALRASVMRAISFDPHARFQSAAEFKTALLTASSASQSNVAYQKPIDTASTSQANRVPPSARQAQETVYSPNVAKRAGKIEDSPHATKAPGKKTKSLLILSAAMLIGILTLVFTLTLPDIVQREPGAESDVGIESSFVSTKSAKNPNERVNWSDPVMAELLSGTLGKNQDEVTYGDLTHMEELYINGDQATISYDEFSSWKRAYDDGKVKTLQDLQYCTNLKKLYIYDQAQDGLDPLSNLTKLEELKLVNCDRLDLFSFDISPLANLIELKRLSLAECSIKDFNVLAPLTKLTNLYVAELSGLEDISAVSEMTRLETLSVSFTSVKRIPDLSKLSNLSFLNISFCDVSDISGLSSSTSLVELHLNDNQITNLHALEGLGGLTELYLSDNKINDIKVLANLDSVTWLDIQDNEITDLSPLMELDSLKYLTVDENPALNEIKKKLEDKLGHVFSLNNKAARK